MSIFSNLEAFGTVETTRSYSYSKHLKPINRLQMQFIENARRQIAELNGGGPLPPNGWVTTRVLGGAIQYKVSLRVGPRLIQLPGGGTHIVMDSKDKVMQFLEGVIDACNKGELDELLLETSGKVKEVTTPPAPESVPG